MRKNYKYSDLSRGDLEDILTYSSAVIVILLFGFIILAVTLFKIPPCDSEVEFLEKYEQNYAKTNL